MRFLTACDCSWEILFFLPPALSQCRSSGIVLKRILAKEAFSLLVHSSPFLQAFHSPAKAEVLCLLSLLTPPLARWLCMISDHFNAFLSLLLVSTLTSHSSGFTSSISSSEPLPAWKKTRPSPVTFALLDTFCNSLLPLIAQSAVSSCWWLVVQWLFQSSFAGFILGSILSDLILIRGYNVHFLLSLTSAVICLQFLMSLKSCPCFCSLISCKILGSMPGFLNCSWRCCWIPPASSATLSNCCCLIFFTNAEQGSVSPFGPFSLNWVSNCE